MADLSGHILAMQVDELGRASSIEAMVTGDVIPESMGGTGVATLADIGPELSATNIVALSLSAGTITSPDFIFSSTDSIIANSVSAITLSGGAITGGSISGTTLSGGDIKGDSVSGTTVSGGAITGASVSATNVSGVDIRGDGVSGTTLSAISFTGSRYNASAMITTPQIVATGTLGVGEFHVRAGSVSSLSVKGTVTSGTTVYGLEISSTELSSLSATIGGCPYPAPFGTMQLTSKGNDSDVGADALAFGEGATYDLIQSNTDHLSYRLGDDQPTGTPASSFILSAAGTYEAELIYSAYVGTTTVVTLVIMKNGSTLNISQPVINGGLDPVVVPLKTTFEGAVSDQIQCKYYSAEDETTAPFPGSTFTVRRIF